jgi:hypothetical protein
VDKHTEYGRIYYEIARGYSKDILNKEEIYFKHPTLAEHFFVYSNYDLIIKTVQQKGVQTESEKLEEAIINDWWSKEKEEKFRLLRKTIDNLIKTKNKLLFSSQKQEIEKEIKKTESIFFTYFKERKDIIGYTAEQYAQEKFFDELIISSCYKDIELTAKYFNNEDEFYDISDDDNSVLRNLYTKYSTCFSSDIIKLIAANGFFQNLIYLDTIPHTFWGKPIVECSKYQIDLLVYGKMFKSTIDLYIKNDKPISEEIINDPEKFIQWFESLNGSKSTTRSRAKNSDKKNNVSSYVGATKEDLDKLGVKVEKLKGKSLLELAEEKGGVLEKSDYFKARENN